MLLLMLLILFVPIENKVTFHSLSNSVYFSSAKKNKIPEIERHGTMEYKIMRLFPPIYDEIFEGRTYAEANYGPMPCLSLKSYYNPEKRAEWADAADQYYNSAFKGKNLTEVAKIFEQEKQEIEKHKHIFVDMHFSKRDDGIYNVSYQVPMEDPMSNLCIVAIKHYIYFYVDEETGLIEKIETDRMLLA